MWLHRSRLLREIEGSLEAAGVEQQGGQGEKSEEAHRVVWSEKSGILTQRGRTLAESRIF